MNDWLECVFVKIRDRERVMRALHKTDGLFVLIQEMVDQIEMYFPNDVRLELALDSLNSDELTVLVLIKQTLEQLQESQKLFECWWLYNNYRANWHLGVVIRCV